jgi:non-lysosomal glucosylceramidase
MSTLPSHPRRLYQGDTLRAVTMPLGGLGTGSIALCGDGSLRQWQIVNQINHLACVPHSFFGVWGRCLRPRGQPVARVLQSAALYDTPGPAAPPTANDHLVPLAHRALLRELPGVQATTFTGEYPIAELAYQDEALPLQVTLEAFSPFIPLETDDSGLPAILFNFTVTNPTDKTWLASLGASLQNVAGWDGGAPLDGVRSFVYGGNSNSLARLGEMTAIHMGTARLPPDDPGYGTLALAALATDATYLTQWDDLHAFWADFADDGRLSNSADSTPSPLGRTWNGALAVPFTLAPGQSRTVTFILAWHFPNRYFDYDDRHYVALLGFSDPKSKFWVGNQYANRFHSALDVAAYVQANAPRLSRLTRLARDTFFDSSLPPALIDAVTSQMSVMRSPTCFWAQDGRFYGFEGCNGASTPQTEPVGGCCPLNCTHVWNYEMALARLYPPLERTMRETEWLVQQSPSGYLPHRVLLPIYLPRPGQHSLRGPDSPALDGLLGGILKTYREVRAGGDVAWLATVWPGVRRALDYIWTAHDPERTGLITGEQPNTYDISIYGLNSFIGTLYLAALLAGEAMAGQMGEAALAAECQGLYEHGRAELDQRLWNGEYYVQDVDFAQHPEQNFGLGCHADHLLGQWWAHQLGLGHLLPEEHLRSAAGAIFTHNFRENFRGIQQAPRVFVADDDAGLVICTWPRGGRPAVPTEYSDEVWTGLEYEVAALLLYEGQPEPAVRILEAARARHDGRKESPWNDVECGDHYVRAMAAWGLLEAALGYDYDAAAGRLGFAPTLSAANFRAPFVAAHGWGTFAQQQTAGRLSASLTLAHGALTLSRLSLAAPAPAASVTVSLDGLPIAASLLPGGGIEFARPLTITAGQTLAVSLISQCISE